MSARIARVRIQMAHLVRNAFETSAFVLSRVAEITRLMMSQLRRAKPKIGFLTRDGSLARMGSAGIRDNNSRCRRTLNDPRRLDFSRARELLVR